MSIVRQNIFSFQRWLRNELLRCIPAIDDPWPDGLNMVIPHAPFRRNLEQIREKLNRGKAGVSLNEPQRHDLWLLASLHRAAGRGSTAWNEVHRMLWVSDKTP